MEDDMLYSALIFFIITIVAAFFGFGGIATTAAGIAQVLFFVFLVISSFAGHGGGRAGGHRSEDELSVIGPCWTLTDTLLLISRGENASKLT
jgi:uncharacterized membrane protein YtjA (UPF0391 family)